MAQMRDRIFAGAGALLFLLSACAVTGYAIWQTTSANSNTPPQKTAQNTSCDINTPVPDKAATAPAVYQPTGPVATLKATDITPGSGAAAKNGDCLVMKYQGNLATTGAIFDENYSKPQDLQFTLGQGQVIQGWDKGLVGMKVGGQRRLEIPASLGYGSQAQGSIPANSDLVFIVTLEKVKKG